MNAPASAFERPRPWATNDEGFEEYEEDAGGSDGWTMDVAAQRSQKEMDAGASPEVSSKLVRVSIPAGSFVAVVSDETDKTEALLPYLAAAHALGRPPGENRHSVFAFCVDPSKPPHRLMRNGAVVCDLQDLVGWVHHRKMEKQALLEERGPEATLCPALLVMHWVRDRKFFQEQPINNLLVDELRSLNCSVVLVSRYMLDLTWAVRSHVDAVLCLGVETLKAIFHLYTQFGSVYHRENEFARLVARRDIWTWIDNSKELPAALKPESERGMYDVLFGDNESVFIQKPAAALVVLPSAEPGGGGLQRLDARTELLADVLRWHAAKLATDKAREQTIIDHTRLDEDGEPTVRRHLGTPLELEESWLARNLLDRVLSSALSPTEYAAFDRRSRGEWNPDANTYALESWSAGLETAHARYVESTPGAGRDPALISSRPELLASTLTERLTGNYASFGNKTYVAPPNEVLASSSQTAPLTNSMEM